MSRYYNNNTRRFLALGHGGGQLAIRRAVWAPGVSSRAEAMEYVNRRIAAELEDLQPLEHVVDLGCGVGGSIAYLRQFVPARFLGVTISGVQAELGRQFLARRGVEDATIAEADYTRHDFWSTQNAAFDAAFAIESFIHVPELLSHIELLGAQLRPGGKLIIVDDTLGGDRPESELPRRHRRWLREFRTGWHAHGLQPATQIIRAAEQAGLTLETDENLNEYLELDRPRDLIARPLISLFRWAPLRAAWFENLLGGNALQLALKRGVIHYRFMVFRRA